MVDGQAAKPRKDELVIASFSTLPSADLDAPTPADIDREWWGYLDPDSPTPAELSRAQVADVPKDAKYLPSEFKLASKPASAGPPKDDSGKKFSQKYESDVMKSFEAAAAAVPRTDPHTSNTAPTAPGGAGAASVVLDGTIEHTHRDVIAKEELLKKLEAERENTAQRLEKETKTQSKIAKTQEWMKENMKAEDSATADEIQALMKAQTGYDRWEPYDE